MARQPTVLGKHADNTLGEALTRMAKLPVAPAVAQPTIPGRRGGAEMGRGLYEPQLLPKQLPYWWPDRVSR
jgi:hypothetical protein